MSKPSRAERAKLRSGTAAVRLYYLVAIAVVVAAFLAVRNQWTAGISGFLFNAPLSRTHLPPAISASEHPLPSKTATPSTRVLVLPAVSDVLAEGARLYAIGPLDAVDYCKSHFSFWIRRVPTDSRVVCLLRRTTVDTRRITARRLGPARPRPGTTFRFGWLGFRSFFLLL
jgi:hypothetical protein